MSAREWVFVPAPGAAAPPTAEVGGKGHHLARLLALAGAGTGARAAASAAPATPAAPTVPAAPAALASPAFRVPRFVVIRAAAFDRFVQGDAPWPATEAEAERRRAEVGVLAIPLALRKEVVAALKAQRLAGVRVAVRSSAAAEDGSSASFAGQFETVLGVRAGDGPEMWDALRSVWASAFLARAAAYRAERAGGAGGSGGSGGSGGVRMAVVIQELVDPEVSGVAFSVDPVSGDRDTAVVSAVYGLGEGLVSGELDADAYHVRFGAAGVAAVTATLAHKDRALRSAPAGRGASSGGTRMEEVPALWRDAPALSDEEARRVAACARSLAVAFGAPQDVEWALVTDGASARELVVLQTRPITTLAPASVAGTSAPAASAATTAAIPAPAIAAELAALAAPAAPAAPAATPRRGDRRVWDNSNIVESYGGVTLPLTFTFARRVYEDVYRQFCRLMGVGEPLIETHRHVFANMLGLVRGRVYYNLLNWYRTLGLLPGFEFNRGFMERMMGVRESLEDPPPPPGAGGRLRDLARLVRMVLRMVRESGRLGAEVPAFHARVEAALAPLSRSDLRQRTEAELVATYHGLERDLLRHWRPPLVNDFFAMIFFGVLCRLIEKWLPESPPTLANDLLCGEGGIISTEPARHVMALARRVAEHPALARHFAAESEAPALLRRLREDPECAGFHRAFEEYVERFGDRCVEELKLETVTLREDPAFLIQMIRSYAALGTVDPEAQRAREVGIRGEAEARGAAQLSGVRRAVFFWVLHRARRRVRDRENLRFERTRVFGMVRRIFLALGEKLAGRGRIESPRDVFYLTIEELFEIGEGRGEALDLAGLVAARRAEFAAFERGAAPPDRFETSGAPVLVFGAEGADDASVAARDSAAGGATLQGTGCCPGVVRERVRVVRDPREARDVAGHILVAERTDPGWTLLFPAARGLLVQRGSLLSHSAIVAREMGLPCVVGIAGLLETLRDGELVEMDGTSGRVVRLDAEAAGA